MKKVAISVLGQDRPGIIATVSRILFEGGCNIENVSQTNLQAVFRGGDNPSDNIMIYEVDIPSDTDHQPLFRELREEAASLGLEISIQHRRIFETLNRI